MLAQLKRVLRCVPVRRAQPFIIVHGMETMLGKFATINEPVTITRLGCKKSVDKQSKSWVSECQEGSHWG